MYYILLIIAAIMFASQFVFSKLNQKTRGTSLYSSLTYAFMASLISLPIFFVISGFKIEFSLYSTIIAFLYGIVHITCVVMGVKALDHANLVVYTLFLMLGGMLLPIFYGLIIGETMSICMVIGVVALIASMLVSLQKTDDGKKITGFTILCLAIIFTANGFAYILTSVHQSNKELAVNPASFVWLCCAFRVLITTIILIGLAIYKKLSKYQLKEVKTDSLVEKRNFKKQLFNLFIIGFGYAIVNGIGNLSMTISAGNLPAVVQYPIITGGCIFFSMIYGLIFGEKITKKSVIRLILVFVGTILMMF